MRTTGNKIRWIWPSFIVSINKNLGRFESKIISISIFWYHYHHFDLSNRTDVSAWKWLMTISIEFNWKKSGFITLAMMIINEDFHFCQMQRLFQFSMEKSFFFFRSFIHIEYDWRRLYSKKLKLILTLNLIFLDFLACC